MPFQMNRTATAALRRRLGVLVQAQQQEAAGYTRRGRRLATACGRRPELARNQATWLSFHEALSQLGSGPLGSASRLPARAAYSHSSSLGSR